MRLAGLAKGGYYPTPTRVVEYISKRISVDNKNFQKTREQRVIRILDPCCGQADAIELLSKRIDIKSYAQVDTYGIELEVDRAAISYQKVNHFLGADLFQTQMTNNAFGILYLNPPYDFDQEQRRVEHAFLTHCTKYLMDDGVLIFIVPRHRLSVSAKYLSAHYRNIQVYAFPDPEYEVFDQIVLIANRRPEIRLMEGAEETIREIALGPVEKVQRINEETSKTWEAQSTQYKEITFATKGIDPLVAATEAGKTGLWVNPFMQDRFWPTETRRRRPLMPLRRGHMAMLMAAGFLDNLCLENNDERVLVKGRTVKKMELISVDEEGGEVWKDKMQTTITSIDLSSGEIRDIQA